MIKTPASELDDNHLRYVSYTTTYSLYTTNSLIYWIQGNINGMLTLILWCRYVHFHSYEIKQPNDLWDLKDLFQQITNTPFSFACGPSQIFCIFRS